MNRSFYLFFTDMASAKRETLLATAEALFYAEGFHATGVDRVVSEAGVARMTLYNHFPSKEALIEAVLARRYARYLEDLRTAVDGAAPGEAVSALVEVHCRWLETTSEHGCMVIRAIGEFEGHHSPIVELGLQLKRELLEVIGNTLARDGFTDVSTGAERLLVVLEGANSLAPVLGSDVATRHLREIWPAVISGRHQGTA